MHLRLKVDVYGSDSIIETYESAEVGGEDAKAIAEVVDNLDETSILSFPRKHGGDAFLTRYMLDRCIITCWIREDETD